VKDSRLPVNQQRIVPPPPPDTESCANCKYWNDQRPEEFKDQAYQMECRRNSPVMVRSTAQFGTRETTIRTWPRVHNTDWCGEWQEKEVESE